MQHLCDSLSPIQHRMSVMLLQSHSSSIFSRHCAHQVNLRITVIKSARQFCQTVPLQMSSYKAEWRQLIGVTRKRLLLQKVRQDESKVTWQSASNGNVGFVRRGHWRRGWKPLDPTGVHGAWLGEIARRHDNNKTARLFQ